MHTLLLGSALAVALVACRANDTLPSDLTGSYTQRAQASVFDAVFQGAAPSAHGLQKERRLAVNSRGISVEGQGMPLLDQKINLGPLQMGTSSTVSDTFSSVSCSGNNCSFRTRGGCEGSIERTGADLVVIADRTCGAWSGRWSPGV